MATGTQGSRPRRGRPARRGGRIALLAATAFVAACSGSGSRPSTVAATGTDPATMLRAAARSMLVASSYRFSGSVSIGTASTAVAGSFQSPDRLHEVLTPAGRDAVEVVFIGARAYVHDRSSARWSRATGSASSGQADPRTAFAVLDRAEQVTRTATGFRFVLPPAASQDIAHVAPGGGALTATGSAVTSAGGIAHLELVIDAPRTIRVSLDYRDVGHGPPVSQPPGT